ncbi:MAG: DUF2637 domain-containing protein [Dactylosporangium sp.]|nr:DUF2637 domain-containing protein [Dactylosporangium sp.]NNJ62329.1 DUF2637 domain-containing protein [Dactylosporangium sp.]
MRHSLSAQFGGAILLALVALLLAVVIVTPIALSSQDLINWAAAPTGLGLSYPWPWLVFVALDAAAGVCVLLSVYCAWRGEPAGIFGVLVWCFAAGSAFANWRHSSVPAAPPDAIWFYPAMSLAGPALLETVLGRLRRWIQRQSGRRGQSMPSFGWRRWIPGIGAARDTYGAWRTALLLGITTLEEAVTTYHQLCPDGSLRVAAALRDLHTRTPTTPDPTSPALIGNDHIPVDLMRRIPIDPAAYRRWQATWADLQTGATNLDKVADNHQVSRRTVEFVRRAGERGLLESELPTAIHLAALSRSGNGGLVGTPTR